MGFDHAAGRSHPTVLHPGHRSGGQHAERWAAGTFGGQSHVLVHSWPQRWQRHAYADTFTGRDGFTAES